MRPLVTAALLCSLSTGVIAQSPPSRMRLNLGVHLPIGIRSHAQVCDGSEMTGVHSRRNLGNILFYGGLGAIVVSPALVSGTDPSNATHLIAAGTIATGVGLYLRYNAAPSDAFWQNTIPQIKVGETRTEDVRQCFGGPNGTTSTGSEATWTYNTTKPGFLGFGGSAQSLSVTMKDGLVTKVSKSEFGF